MTKISQIELQDIKDRAIEFTGHTDDLNEAFDQWGQEREALAQALDENKTLRTLETKLTKLLHSADKTIATVEKETGLFMSMKITEALGQWRAEYRELLIEIAGVK